MAKLVFLHPVNGSKVSETDFSRDWHCFGFGLGRLPEDDDDDEEGGGEEEGS